MNITEKYFRAIGWRYVDQIGNNPYGWFLGSYHHRSLELPNITESFSAFKKWVLEKMVLGDGRPMKYSIGIERGDDWNWWADHTTYSEPIKNNEILEAAVIAATRYFKGKVD